MTDLTRRQLLGRGAAGASVLTIPGLLAACGSSGGIKAPTHAATSKPVKKVLAKTLNFSNWPLYIDVNSKNKSHPSLDEFTKKTGVKVAYSEDINDNQSY